MATEHRALALWRASLALGARGLRAALDIALPPVCPLTEQVVDAPGRLAPQAWASLTFLAPPWCAICGFPFACDHGPGSMCGPCAARPPRFARARAPLAYDDASRPLVLDLKHGGRTDALETFAGWMAQAGGEVLAEVDALVPVPLHPARLRARRFNQSALLANALGARAGIRVDCDLLMRRRKTPSQAGLTARGRARNVAGAFALRPGAQERLAGLRIALIDDVYTTGATLSACARPLLRGGAQRVDALALARVVRPRDGTI